MARPPTAPLTGAPTGEPETKRGLETSSIVLTSWAGNRALFSPKETEAILSVSHATCYRLIAAGKLDARKLGGKTLITGESIERLVAELPKIGRRT